MPQYYLSKISLQVGLKFKITNPEFKHIKINRNLKIGALLNIKDSNKKIFECIILEFTKVNVWLFANKELFLNNQINSLITICISYIKEKNLNLVLQKATELNVANIIIFAAKRSQFWPKLDSKNNKTERRQKIMDEAAKQSGRLDTPNLTLIKDFREVISHLITQKSLIYLADKNAKKKLVCLPKYRSQKKAVFIGPEGGFTEGEITLLNKAGAKKINLGNLTLRAETAAIAAMAILNYELKTF